MFDLVFLTLVKWLQRIPRFLVVSWNAIDPLVLQAQAYAATLIKNTSGFSWHEFSLTETSALGLASK